MKKCKKQIGKIKRRKGREILQNAKGNKSINRIKKREKKEIERN